MQIKDFLSPDDVIADAVEQDKDRLLRRLSAQAAARLGNDADLIFAKVLERERLGSTGLGDGIAIPHARIQGLAGPLGVCARLKRGIDFDAIDGKPVDIVFLLLLPVAATADPLGAIASVARKLRDKATATAIRGAKDDQDVYQALGGD
jgi:PTS system nitrogen regulatory IIA component